MKKIILQYSARNKRLEREGITYKQYLASSFWLEIRTKLKKLPEFNQCYCCGSCKNIHLHHKRYKYIFSKKLHKHRQTIVALCAYCHKSVHKITEEKNHSLGSAVKAWKKKRTMGTVSRVFKKDS